LQDNLTECVEIARNLQIEFVATEQGIRVLLDHEDVSKVIRTEEVGAFASRVAVVPELRDALLQRQRFCPVAWFNRRWP
jgi:cytidylate kinase